MPHLARAASRATPAPLALLVLLGLLACGGGDDPAAPDPVVPPGRYSARHVGGTRLPIEVARGIAMLPGGTGVEAWTRWLTEVTLIVPDPGHGTLERIQEQRFESGALMAIYKDTTGLEFRGNMVCAVPCGGTGLNVPFRMAPDSLWFMFHPAGSSGPTPTYMFTRVGEYRR